MPSQQTGRGAVDDAFVSVDKCLRSCIRLVHLRGKGRNGEAGAGGEIGTNTGEGDLGIFADTRVVIDTEKSDVCRNEVIAKPRR